MYNSLKTDRLRNINIPRHHVDFLSYHYLHRDLLLMFDKYAKGTLLDIGCGNKPYKKYLETRVTEYVGCDIEQSSLEVVDVICSATNIPLENDSFDTIICTQVLEHIADHLSVIKEAHRLLKKGGVAIFSVPFVYQIHEAPHDFFRFSKYGIKHLVESSEFELIECYPNGGKWATIGLMLSNNLVKSYNASNIVKLYYNKIYNKIVLTLINQIFKYIDKKHFDEGLTSNYVFICKK
jgi:SAM-dependent methyltransferase